MSPHATYTLNDTVRGGYLIVDTDTEPIDVAIWLGTRHISVVREARSLIESLSRDENEYDHNAAQRLGVTVTVHNVPIKDAV